MQIFSIYNQDKTQSSLIETVKPNHFGANLLLTQPPSDSQVLTDSYLASGISALNISSLRYPGGGVTESLFSMTNPNATVSSASGQKLVSQHDFLELCSERGLTANLVIQTSTGFTKSAAEALLSNEYGSRTIDSSYLINVREYVKNALLDAFSQTNPVVINSFEIGNEFWGTGQMTSKEYGRLAAAVLVAAENGISDAYYVHPEMSGVKRPELLVQSIHADGAFSPSNDQIVLVGGGAVFKSMSDVPNGTLVTSVLIEGLGNAGAQLSNITDPINNSLSSSLIDGVVDHYYASQGFVEVDSASDYTFYQMNQFELQTGHQVGSLGRYVTEWNTKLSSALDNRGIKGAAMLTEIFYEMVTHGISDLNIWPLIYDSARNNVLQGDAANITAAGSVFKFMSESLLGTKPTLDYNLSSDGTTIDVHAFSSDSKIVLFTNNRSDHTVDGINLDLGNSQNALNPNALSQTYFIVNSYITENDQILGSDPVTQQPIYGTSSSFGNGSTESGTLIGLGDLSASAIVRTEITYITAEADTLVGRDGNDKILSGDGSDLIYGNGGLDILDGEKGNDKIFGGDGIDRIYGGEGRDFIDGGEHGDILRGGNGDDGIYGGGGNDWIDGGLGNDAIFGGGGDDKLWGGGGMDQFVIDLRDEGVDSIIDFDPSDDSILISHALDFGVASGRLPSEYFQVSSIESIHFRDTKILYDRSSGDIYIDRSSEDGFDQHFFLHLNPGLDLTANNFLFL